MPIIIRDFIWKQSNQRISIKVPLKGGVCKNKVDIFTSSGFIKVSYEQFFWEIFPLHPVNVSESKCTITSADIIFEIIKEEENLHWESLEKNLSKEEKIKLKKFYIDEELKKLQEANSERTKKKGELQREAVREQIDLDSQQRKRIEEIKKEEKHRAFNIFETSVNNKKEEQISDESENEEFLELVRPKREKKKTIVPIRPIRSLEVVLATKREFPTPLRESKIAEENEWLKKQAEARRSVGFISEDIRAEERNPQYLLDKGNEFMKNKNYLGAISAYSFGIKINKNFADLYIARSEAHLNIGNYNKTVLDCSTALDLMKPAVDLNLKERALCIGRRGVALIKLDRIREGIGELEASLKLEPNQAEYRKELEQLL